MGKTQIGLFLETETADLLRHKASVIGAGYGDLADLLIRVGLERLTEDALRRWALSLTSKKGRLGGGPSKDERRVLATLERLGRETPGLVSCAGLANETGMPPKETFFALRALQARGSVRCVEQTAELDRWSRPVESFWEPVAVDALGEVLR